MSWEGAGHAMVHIFPSIIPEKRCSRIPEMQEENLVEHHHA